MLAAGGKFLVANETTLWQYLPLRAPWAKRGK
jgi:hypothetical protein